MKYVKVLIGRFQPFHNGHLKVLHAAIDTADLVVVVIGSADALRSGKNPFDVVERYDMINLSLRPAERPKVRIVSQNDKPGSDSDWVKEVKAKVRKVALQNFGKDSKFRFTLVGCHKDASTYYLKLYRGWGLDLIPQSESMNATDVRREYFSPLRFDEYMVPRFAKNLPPASAAYMMAFRDFNREAYRKVCNDFDANDQASKSTT
jgi:bifunctional NMN adenylyltransferase/nudix hydrolase